MIPTREATLLFMPDIPRASGVILRIPKDKLIVCYIPRASGGDSIQAGTLPVQE